MSRLFVLVEGETEETFVNEVLAPHFYQRGFHAVSAKLMGNARLRSRRGGIRGWPDVQRDIVGHLRHDASLVLTTMVDYYGLPSGADNPRAWPGRMEAGTLPFERKARNVEDSMLGSVRSLLGSSWNPKQFVPFVMMHEFEGMLFSDCARFARAIGRDEMTPAFQAIRDRFQSPEEINDSPATHPSARIVSLIPEYEKPLLGNLAALEIGLGPIRQQCPHFADWLARLEQIA